MKQKFAKLNRADASRLASAVTEGFLDFSEEDNLLFHEKRLVTYAIAQTALLSLGVTVEVEAEAYGEEASLRRKNNFYFGSLMPDLFKGTVQIYFHDLDRVAKATGSVVERNENDMEFIVARDTAELIKLIKAAL